MSAAREAPARGSRREVAAVFLKLGLTAFGGPAAHVALMEDELVRRRRWLDRQTFLDYYAATQLIPGPNSTELAIHLGRERAGWPGFWIAGLCFIAPAAVLVAALAWAYARYGTLPDVAAVLRGISPVVIAIIAQALLGLARTALRTRWLVALALACAAAALVAHELVVLFAGGALAALGFGLFGAGRRGSGRSHRGASGGGGAGASPSHRTAQALGAFALPLAAATPAGAAALPTLFATFLKIGAVVFGSGYVLVAFLRADFVERLGWLTERQLLDAVAAGQITPGPVFTTATFIGMLVGGPPGAALATAGIFLPAFACVAATSPWIPRLRSWPLAGAALDGLNAASLALMAVVMARLARAALVDPATWAIAIASAIALFRFRVGAMWLVMAGGAVGWALGRF